MTTPSKGTLVDQYEVDEHLGSGTIGSVFKAHPISNPSNTIAIKILSDELVSHDRAFLYFRHQFSQIYQAADERHIKIERAFRDGVFTGYSMEFAAPGNLSVRRQKHRSDDNLIPDLELLLELAEAINHFHQRGIILRVIKPTNILITGEGRIKLADVGLSHIPSVNHLRAKSHGLGCKLIPYLPPEYLSGMKLDTSADLYSFGVIAYELLTGELPFESVATSELLDIESRETIIPLTQRAPEIPAQLEELIWSTLRVNPNYRHGSAGVLIAELAHIRDGIRRDREQGRCERTVDDSLAESRATTTIMIDGNPLELDESQDQKYEKGTRRKPRSGTFLWRQGIPGLGEG